MLPKLEIIKPKNRKLKSKKLKLFSFIFETILFYFFFAFDSVAGELDGSCLWIIESILFDLKFWSMGFLKTMEYLICL